MGCRSVFVGGIRISGPHRFDSGSWAYANLSELSIWQRFILHRRGYGPTPGGTWLRKQIAKPKDTPND